MQLYCFLRNEFARIQKYTRKRAIFFARMFQTPTLACDLAQQQRVFRELNCVNKIARAKIYLHPLHFFRAHAKIFS
jgi:hypothetical protein